MTLPPVRRIGETIIQPKHRASCHCGGVVLELDLPEGIVDARRCTCSMCRRKGAIMGAVPLQGLRILQGQELLTVYRFNTRTAEHYFCSRCGIYTHHRRRSKPDQYGYNLGCLEGVDPNLVQGVPVNDGVNHPADRQPPGQAAAAAARADIAMLTAIPRHWFSWDFTLFEKGVPFAQLAMSLWREKGGFTVGTCRQMDSSAAA